jgi:hypothetical protein
LLLDHVSILNIYVFMLIRSIYPCLRKNYVSKIMTRPVQTVAIDVHTSVPNVRFFNLICERKFREKVFLYVLMHLLFEASRVLASCSSQDPKTVSLSKWKDANLKNEAVGLHWFTDHIFPRFQTVNSNNNLKPYVCTL